MSDMLSDMLSAKSSSFNNVNHLPDDVLVEIFIRLPFRSTAKCKCVCNRWLELISRSYFPTQFISHQHSIFKAFLIFLTPHELMLAFLSCPFPTPSLMLPSLDLGYPKVPLSPDILVKGNVCGCSNGLLLCCINRYTTGRGYYVYDPFTKRCAQIPLSPVTGKEHLYAVGFLYDPCYPLEDNEEKDERMISLNLDGCFWVVIIKSFIRREYVFEVEFFSSDLGTWRQVHVNCVDGFAFAPHWMLSFAYDECLYFMGRTSIFVFDPVSLHSFTIDYPQGADAMNIMSFGYLGISCGSLRIADIGRNDLRVWELIDLETWHLIHRTNLSAHLPAEFCANYYKRVGGFHPYDGNIVYLHSYADGVLAANLRTNKFEAIPGYEKSDISPFQLELPPPIPLTD